MKMRPIIFDGESVRAILDERKWMTRRVIKPQPDEQLVFAESVGFSAWVSPSLNLDEGAMRCCPYGIIGDGLWVRETWQHCPECGRIEWRADANEGGAFCRHCDGMLSARWKPSIHMFREDSRIDLVVTGMRAERLQDISEEDAEAEGVRPILVPPDGGSSPHIEGFIARWNAINAKRGYPWESNWWVWVPEFERVNV